MKIQLITSRNLQKRDYSHITISEFGQPRSLDEFDVNIVDLGSENLWKTKEHVIKTIDRIADFHSIQSMVIHRKKAIVVYSLPIDVYFSSYDSYEGEYKKRTRLKDSLISVGKILQSSFPDDTVFPDLLYEKTTTSIGIKAYNADFYFEHGHSIVTLSDLSQKPTTISQKDYLYLTTLDITVSEQHLIDYIDYIFPKQEYEEVPEWVRGTEFFDDHEQKELIISNNTIIEKARSEIELSEKRLDENMYYKSVLYKNGTELVDVVFDILEKILSCDLSKFVDEKKEDFLIKKDAYTLIGEIKGVSSNIKNEHISQVDVHYQGYKDRLFEDGLQEEVRQVLIINPFKNKPICEREPVHETQIKLAERNGCLIIETITLLKLYEKFVAGEIDAPACEKLFFEKTGLLKERDF